MPQNESPAKVLVVDDRPDVADALGGLVRSLGYVAEVANEADTAIELARCMRPDIAIVDLRLGDSDGARLAAQLRAEATEADRRLHLVAMSGFDLDLTRSECRAGFDDFFTKPPEIEALVRVLRDFRGRRRDLLSRLP
jgi:CheY-like chemotaxis protein